MEEKTKLKFLSVFLVVALLVGLVVPASAASASDPYDLIWHASSSTRTYDDLTYLYYTVSSPDSQGLTSWWFQEYLTLVRLKNDTAYMSTVLRSFADRTRNSLTAANEYLLNIHNNISSIKTLVTNIRDFVSPQYKRDLESNQEDNIEQITDDFFSGDQTSSSLGTDDFSDLKSFTSEAGVMLSSPVEPSQFTSSMSTALSSNGGLGFFSSSVRDDLQPPSVELQDESEVEYLDFLSPLISEVDSLVGGQNG